MKNCGHVLSAQEEWSEKNKLRDEQNQVIDQAIKSLRKIEDFLKLGRAYYFRPEQIQEAIKANGKDAFWLPEFRAEVDKVNEAVEQIGKWAKIIEGIYGFHAE